MFLQLHSVTYLNVSIINVWLSILISFSGPQDAPAKNPYKRTNVFGQHAIWLHSKEKIQR